MGVRLHDGRPGAQPIQDSTGMFVLQELKCKMALQVIQKFQMVAENNSYFLNVGTKVDVAFICMCAFAIDELFSDD